MMVIKSKFLDAYLFKYDIELNWLWKYKIGSFYKMLLPTCHALRLADASTALARLYDRKCPIKLVD